jgi:hypothetical protein
MFLFFHSIIHSFHWIFSKTKSTEIKTLAVKVFQFFLLPSLQYSQIFRSTAASFFVVTSTRGGGKGRGAVPEEDESFGLL